jgi:predicted ArsR family transcriptional regulator
MPKQQNFHPKAYLTSRRNVKKGLLSRTKILLALESGGKSATQIAKETSLSYERVGYHLTAMKKDRLVEKSTKTRPFRWNTTRFGQQKLPA